MQSLAGAEKGDTQIDTPGGKQQMSIVNERGLYAMLWTLASKFNPIVGIFR